MALPWQGWLGESGRDPAAVQEGSDRTATGPRGTAGLDAAAQPGDQTCSGIRALPAQAQLGTGFGDLGRN